jgi:hypothetical protein
VEHGPGDTDRETLRAHLDLLRSAPPSRRLRLALSLSRTTLGLAHDGISRGLPGASPEEVGLRFVALNYGRELAGSVRADLAARRS